MEAAKEDTPATLEELLGSGRAEDVEAMLDTMHADELLHEIYVLAPGTSASSSRSCRRSVRRRCWRSFPTPTPPT